MGSHQGKGPNPAEDCDSHPPIDKLKDGFIGMLAGAQGLVETNKRVCSDRALKAAFNRQGCAELAVTHFVVTSFGSAGNEAGR